MPSTLPIPGFDRLLSKLSPKAAQELAGGPGLTLAYALPTSVDGILLQDTHLQIHLRPSQLKVVLRYLRDEESLQYTTLTAMNVVDRPTAALRFGVVYQLLSYTLEHRLQVICLVNDHESLPSVVDLYPSAQWSECENWDMFGIHTLDHPNLYRLLTDYGFEGHPLRKDYPLSGFTEVRYDEDLQQVVSTPVELAQEYRVFDYSSPWKTF